MAVKYAISSSLWSLASTWSGSSKPAAGDDVYANRKVVIVDEDTPNLNLLTTTAITGVLAGGTFRVTGSRTITALDVLAGGASGVPGHCISWSGSASDTLTVYGNVRGSSTSPGNECGIYGRGGSGNIVVVGNVISGDWITRNGIESVSGATVTVVGNVTAARGHGISRSTGGTTNVTGNVAGGGTWQGIQTGNGNIINVTGNVSGAGGQGMNGGYSSVYNITGNVTSGAFSGVAGNTITVSVVGNVHASGSAVAISSGQNGGDVTVVGDVRSGGNVGIYLVNTTLSDTIIVTGNLYPNLLYPAVVSESYVSELFLSGSEFLAATGSRMPYVVSKVYVEDLPEDLTFTFKKWDGTTDFVLYSGNLISSSAVYPNTSDVRKGVTFGYSGEYEGTLSLPSKELVLEGVQVGQETGELRINPVKRFKIGR